MLARAKAEPGVESAVNAAKYCPPAMLQMPCPTGLPPLLHLLLHCPASTALPHCPGTSTLPHCLCIPHRSHPCPACNNLPSSSFLRTIPGLPLSPGSGGRSARRTPAAAAVTRPEFHTAAGTAAAVLQLVSSCSSSRCVIANSSSNGDGGGCGSCSSGW